MKRACLAMCLACACNPPAEPATASVPTLPRAAELSACTLEPTIVARGEDAPYALTATADGFAWTVSTNGRTTVRAWRSITNETVTLTSRAAQVGALAVHDDRLFFAERAIDSSDKGRVVVGPAVGGHYTVIATGSAGAIIDEYAIAVDDHAAYWVSHDGAGKQAAWKLVHGRAQAERIGVASPPVDQSVVGAAVDLGYFYWATQAGWIYRVATQGGEAKLIVDDTDGIGGWAVRSGIIVYADLSTRGLHMVEAGHTRVLQPNAGARHAVAIDDDYVYYSTGSEVRALPRRGGSVESIAQATSVGAISRSGKEVAWAETRMGDGAISRRCAATPAPPTQCPGLALPRLGLCVTATWTAGPAVSAHNAYELRFWRAADGEDGPFIDPAAVLTVKPWMPAHGHGTTTTTVTRDAPGVFAVSDVNLSMPGAWELRHDALDGQTVVDQWSMTIDVR